MGAFRTFRFIIVFVVLIVLGLYSLHYSQGRVEYAGPVEDTPIKGSVTGASLGDAWERITSSFTPLPDQAERIAPSDSITDSVTRDILDLYLQAKIAGNGSVSTSTIAALATSVAKYGKGYIDINRYVSADVLLAAGDTQDAQKSYLNALATIIYTRFHDLPERGDYTKPPPELAAFLDTLQTQNFAHLQRIAPYEHAYASATKDLLLLRVPSSYAAIHLDIMNSFATSEECLVRLRAFEADPLGAIYGWQTYIEEYARGIRDMKLLVTMINSTSLSLSEGDPAYGLLQYLTKSR